MALWNYHCKNTHKKVTEITVNALALPVSCLGYNEERTQQFKNLRLMTLGDLLLYLPTRYAQSTQLTPINLLETEQTALVFGKIENLVIPSTGNTLSFYVNDGTGRLGVRLLNFKPGEASALKKATNIQCEGKVGFYLEMVRPKYKIRGKNDGVVLDKTLTPIYRSTKGLKQEVLRKAILQALRICAPDLVDYLPEELLKHFGYPDLLTALQQVHTPTAGINPLLALQRLSHEELIVHYLSLRHARQYAKQWKAPIFLPNKRVAKEFLDSLPFKLTGAQQRVIAEIAKDCTHAQPMLRLVQGDVGSGKTLVAAMTALLAISNGYQVALMAPTELLAEQHYRNFGGWLEPFAHQILYLTGQLKGKARDQGLADLAEGKVQLAIGTHALFQEQVQFKKLGLIIIDEQHRFGVDQRLALRDKGEHGDSHPHQLVMTATPIPRTLAMMQYADLDVSIIDELPPNRQPVVTRVLSANRREEIIARIHNWVATKRQAYWVCTLIEESDVLQGEAAETTAQMLAEALPNVRIGLVHGRMKAAEKAAVMQAFKLHEIDLLVATTVIEVGVDVPNSGLMIIENPERLGLSQLHQLRGRVGRGEGESYCLLLYSSLPEMARERLKIMRENTDGFVIAEMDLELRGAGEVLGTRQKGQMRFKTVNPERDGALFETIPKWGDALLTAAPENVPLLIERWLSTAVSYVEV